MRVNKQNIEKPKAKIRQMFDAIAPVYDFLNLLLSLGIDRYWRKKVLKILKSNQPKIILDVATGTADLALAALALEPKKIIGVDLSEEMLKIGRQKITKKNKNHIIDLQCADAENLPFADGSFDAVMIAFGVRNFEDLQKGLQEMRRVLKDRQKIVILELTTPTAQPLKTLYLFYSKYILPTIGRIFSKDATAYEYLPASIEAFAQAENFLKEMRTAGFVKVEAQKLSGGIATLYIGEK